MQNDLSLKFTEIIKILESLLHIRTVMNHAIGVTIKISFIKYYKMLYNAMSMPHASLVYRIIYWNICKLTIYYNFRKRFCIDIYADHDV